MVLTIPKTLYSYEIPHDIDPRLFEKIIEAYRYVMREYDKTPSYNEVSALFLGTIEIELAAFYDEMYRGMPHYEQSAKYRDEVIREGFEEFRETSGSDLERLVKRAIAKAGYCFLENVEFYGTDGHIYAMEAMRNTPQICMVDRYDIDGNNIRGKSR